MAKAKSSLALLPSESLQSCLESLMDIYSCSVCLEVVRPDPVQCINEHIVCRECTAGLTECPTCRRPFSGVKASRHVSQVIEVFPKICKHKNCDVFLEPGDDHEKYCGLKETKCKMCGVNVPGQEIMAHLEIYHPNTKIFTAHEDNYRYPNFNPDTPLLYHSIFCVNDYFIWISTVNKPKEKTYHRTCYLVLKSKPKDNIFLKIIFSSKVSEFICKIKLNPDPDVDSLNENTISVPFKLLSDYIDSDNSLKYRVEFSTEPL